MRKTHRFCYLGGSPLRLSTCTSYMGSRLCSAGQQWKGLMWQGRIRVKCVRELCPLLHLPVWFVVESVSFALVFVLHDVNRKVWSSRALIQKYEKVQHI